MSKEAECPIEAHVEFLHNIDKRVDKVEMNTNQLATSIEHLVSSIGATNTKLDTLSVLLSNQNVLTERIASMDKECVESFNRIYKRVDKIEGAIAWVVKTLIGAFMTGLVATIFMLARS